MSKIQTNLPVDRERTVWSLFHRVSPGKWIALYFVARATSFATGCSDPHAAGTLGNKCIQSCNDPHCDQGLLCKESSYDQVSGGVCITAPADSGSNPGPYFDAACELASSPECEESEAAFSCPAGNTSSLPNAVCRLVQESIFCCETFPSGSAPSDASSESSSDPNDASSDASAE